jgi:hypothetical protein
METNETDKMLKNFFSGYKQEIPDNGFTLRVMRKLPEHTDRSWIVWVFAACGMALSLYLGLSTGLFQNTLALVVKIPIYYLLAGIFCFPLASTIGYFISQNRKLELF